MKIVIYTFEFLPFGGGIATYCHELARGLTATGYDVTVVAPISSDLDVEAFPYRIHRMDRSRLRIVSMFKGIGELRRLVKSARPDVVLVTNQYALISVALFGKLVGATWVPIIHGSEVLKHGKGRRLARRMLAWRMRGFYRSVVGVICVSRYTRELFLSVFDVLPTCVFVVHNGMRDDFNPEVDCGVEIRRKWEIPKGARVLFTLARLVPRKGQDVVIRALPAILERYPNVVYLCAGIGPYRATLEKLAIDCGVAQQVIFTGRIEDREKYSYYSACDLFVMLSRQEGDTVEGFGLTFLEAWHSSRPVLGGRHGGVVEVIEDGLDGALVEPDNVDAVSTRIISLIGDPSRLRAMGRRGHDKALTRFSDVTMANLVASCLYSVIGRVD